MSKFSLPAPLQRAGILLSAFAALQVLWPLCGIVISSEKWHLSMPLLWLLDFAMWGRHRLPKPWTAYLPAAIVLVFAIWGICRLLLEDQARTIYGRVEWSEPFFKTWFIAGVFVIYSVWSRLLWWIIGRVPRAQSTLKSKRAWSLRVAHNMMAIAFFAPWLFTTFNIHRSKIATRETPLSFLKLPYENARFQSDDGVTLHGWFIPGTKSKQTVVVVHGVGANKADFMGVAPFLHRAGWNVFFFDMRGHGDSGGHTTSFGFHEARDVQGAVRWLSHEKGQTALALYGFSMGGSAVLHAFKNAQSLPQVRAVVVDSTFADLTPLAASQATFLPPLLRRAWMANMDLWARVELGTSIASIAPRRHIAHVAPRPIFIIHGLSDGLIAPQQARWNYAAAKQPKVLWLVPGANHCLCRLSDPPPYEKRVANFLRNAFDHQ